MSDVMDYAPRNVDQQIGFDLAFGLIAGYWTAVMSNISDDHDRVQQVDSFMAAIMAKLSGYSNQEAYALMDGLRDGDLFG